MQRQSDRLLGELAREALVVSEQPADVRRVTRSKQQAQSTYDRMSGWYDIVTDPFEGIYRRQGLDLLQVKSGERVLEIGPGPGQALAAMAALVGDDGHIAGLDLSMGMLKRARRRLRQANMQSAVWLEQGDGTNVPFRPACFDAAFISFALELFDTPDIPKVLLECRRVLVEGGRLCVVSMAKQDKTGFMTRAYLWFRQLFPTYLDCRPIRVQQDVENAGFSIRERVDFSMFGLPGAIVLAQKA